MAQAQQQTSLTIEQQRDWLRKWNESGREELVAQLTPESANDEQRTIDIIWFTGIDVPRYSWVDGPYVLKFDPKGADLSLLNNRAPVCDNHFAWSIDDQLGSVDKAWIKDGKYCATVRFKRSTDLTGPRPRVDGLWQDIKDGIHSKFSMGVEILESTEKRDKDGKLTEKTALKWRPFEISSACIPADFGTTTLSAEPDPVPDPAPPTTNLTDSEKPTSENHGATAHKENAMENNLTATTTAAAPATPPPDVEALKKEAAKAAVESERLRVKTIDERLNVSGLKPETVATLRTTLVDGGSTPEDASNKIFDALAKQHQEQPETRGHVALGGVDAVDQRRECMAAAVLYRAEPQTFSALKDKAQPYRGYTLYDLARECLEATGVKVRGMSRSEIVHASLMHPSEFVHRFTGGHTTSDFPSILENIATKSLRQAYEAAPPTFRAIARQVGVSDFKTSKAVQLSDMAALTKVNEKGEFKSITISDNGEPYAIATYGNVISITRQVIINDDLQALVRIPQELGKAAARTESDVFWDLIKNNVNMSDSVAFFHANHNNLNTGAGSAFADAGLGAGRAKLRLQTGPKGTILNYTPRYVVGPAALEHTILKFVNPMQLAASQASNVVPQWITQLTPVIEGRLDANSTTAWYLVAEGDGAIFCYLEGQEGVYTETKNGFEVDGVSIKARLDFGAALVEYRTWQKNVGA